MAENEQQGTKNKTWKLFGAAVIFALLAGVGTIIFLKLLEHRLEERLTPAQQQMVQVVVASGDLPVGSKVDSSTMSVRKIPSEYVNSDVITPDLFDSIDGAVLIKPLGHGKMLSQEYINLNIPKDFSDTIQIGHRAVTIQVDEINSISGLVRPGNFIDLYARMQGSSIPALESSDSGEVVIPVLEDVFVLATDRHSARPNEDEFINMNPADHRRTYDTLTLEVTPKEAALINLAESRGSLIASLRNTKDTAGVLFRKIGLGDLVAHSDDLLQQAIGKQHSRSLDGVYVDKDGHLVTRDGIVITDPNIHLNKNGLLVNKDGTVLSGRDLFAGEDGRLRTKDGKLVDTESLVAGKDGTLVDKNGTVLGSNGYQTVKGGFLVDRDGHVITNNGEVLSGVTVGSDGRVRAPDGRVITAGQLAFDKDGKVRIKSDTDASMTVDADGNVRTADGKIVEAKNLVTVGPDGVVRTKDGKVLTGVTVGKDGELYSSTGKKLSAADVMMAAGGFTPGADGTVVDRNGKVYTTKDLVVGEDGKVRDKNGSIVEGAYVDKDGKVRIKSDTDASMSVDADGNVRTADGKIVEAKDLVTVGPDGVVRTKDGKVLTGVTVGKDGGLYSSTGKKLSAADVMMAAGGFTPGADGTVVDRNGKVYTTKDLVDVGGDGKVRDKNGRVIEGAYVDKDGKIRNKAGALLTAQDVVRQSAVADMSSSSGQGEILAGVTGSYNSRLAENIGLSAPVQLSSYVPYEVEYIVGGSSDDGAAKTFRIQVEDNKTAGNKDK